MTSPYATAETMAYSRLLAESFARWTGQSILPKMPNDDALLARALYDAPFALVSHGTQADPIFRYANRTALLLWEMEWDEFTQLPSRRSAEPARDIQDERQQLLKRALESGFVDDYAGIRISKTGKRFEIQNTTLWNVMDAAGVRHGQAALIREWRYV